MKQIDDLTMKQVKIPAGRSVTDDDLDIAERALATLLSCYTDEVLKRDLRIMLLREVNTHEESAFLLDHDLMKPAELYRLISAAQLLEKHLFNRSYRRIERRAAEGDPEAIKDLALING